MSKANAAIKALTDLRHIPLHGLRFRVVDAQGQIVGHLASQIAGILQGKDKPTFSPKKNCGDVVVVINAAHVHFTHDTWNTKLYRWHTGLPGGLKERTAVEQWDREPTKILRDAVKGMLPKNKTQVYRMDKLKVFAEDDHPFGDFDLVPYVPTSKPIKLPGIGWPMPSDMQPANAEKFAFRVRAAESQRQGAPAAASKTAAIDFTDLMTEEERAVWAAKQKLVKKK